MNTNEYNNERFETFLTKNSQNGKKPCIYCNQGFLQQVTSYLFNNHRIANIKLTVCDNHKSLLDEEQEDSSSTQKHCVQCGKETQQTCTF